MSEQELNEMISEIVNTLSGNLAPETMSRTARDIGGTFLIARNWTYSNIKEGKGALGFLPKYWSPEQKGFVRKWYQKALLRGFVHMLAAAQVVNYLVSKHSYGEGRFTWQNEGRWDFKVSPLLWVDKRTGREFYATGWYGSLGDIVHWLTRPITTLEHKLNVPVREVMQQLANLDFFTKERIQRDSDSLIEGIQHRLQHAAEHFLTPAGVDIVDQSKYPTPLGPKVLKVFGLMLASTRKDQDLLQKMFNFKEKKHYKERDIDRELYKLLAEGNQSAFMKRVREERRYQTLEGAIGMKRKFGNPLASYFRSLSHHDRREFLRTLSPKEKARLAEAIRRKQQ